MQGPLCKYCYTSFLQYIQQKYNTQFVAVVEMYKVHHWLDVRWQKMGHPHLKDGIFQGDQLAL